MNKTQDAELIKEKTRLTRALADNREFRNAVQRGEYVKKSDVQKAYDKIASNIRKKLLAMPGQLTTRLFACDNQNEMNAMLTESIYEILNSFADEEGVV